MKRYVLVRTYSAGVHVGCLESQSADGKRVVLSNSRRIWSWRGANTLNEIALRGVGKGSRVSQAVARIELTESIEVIDCTEEAVSNLERGLWA